MDRETTTFFVAKILTQSTVVGDKVEKYKRCIIKTVRNSHD